MKQLVEDCLEFLLKTVAGMFILAIFLVLILIAVFWPSGEVEPLPWLGVVGTDIDAKTVQDHRLPFSKGVYVERVLGNSPADYSNVAKGDFIVKFNNRIVLSEAELLLWMPLTRRSKP